MDDRELRQLAWARAGALAVDISAVAAGVLEPTPQALDALASLAAAVVFDLAVAA